MAGSDQVGSINGIPFYKEDLKLWMYKERADVCQYFYSEYTASPNEGFWSELEEIGGHSPIAKLREQALQSLVEAECLLQLSHANGLIQAKSSLDLRAIRRLTNEDRARKLERGQVIYGPKSYGEHVFQEYVLSNLKIQLADRLSRGELSIPASMLQSTFVPKPASIEELQNTLRHQANVSLGHLFHTISLR